MTGIWYVLNLGLRPVSFSLKVVFDSLRKTRDETEEHVFDSLHNPSSVTNVDWLILGTVTIPPVSNLRVPRFLDFGLFSHRI